MVVTTPGPAQTPAVWTEGVVRRRSPAVRSDGDQDRFGVAAADEVEECVGDIIDGMLRRLVGRDDRGAAEQVSLKSVSVRYGWMTLTVMPSADSSALATALRWLSAALVEA